MVGQAGLIFCAASCFIMDSTPTYSVENGVRFAWSSLTGDLNPERVDLLNKNVCGQTILDAGCGGGAFVEFLGAKGLQVTGLDRHGIFLDVARLRPGAQGTYVEGDITALPFPDQQFDCTYCLDVLEHVDDAAALAELIRVTRQKIIIAVPATDADVIGGGLTFHHYRDLTHLRTYTRESLATLLRSHGQHQFQISPELHVDLHLVAVEHLRPASTPNPLKSLMRNGYHALLRRMLSYARFSTYPTGWTAVIDLAPSRPA